VTAVLRPQQARIRGQLVVYRTDSGQEVRNRRFSLPPIFYNSICSLNLQLQDTTIIYCGRPAYYYYYRLSREDPPTTTNTTTAVTEAVFAFRAKNFKKYGLKNL
jgi:hypothetical protein